MQEIQQRCKLDLINSHPEEEDDTRRSRSQSEWLNHGDDKMANAGYELTGTEDVPGCLRHQRKWRMERTKDGVFGDGCFC